MVNFDTVPETSTDNQKSHKSMRKTRRLSWASLIVALTTLAALWPLIGPAWGFASGIVGAPAAGSVNAKAIAEQKAALAQERTDRAAAIQKEHDDRQQVELRIFRQQGEMNGKLDVLIGRGH